jgi:hypothetical protein
MNKYLDEFLFRDFTLWNLDRYSCIDKWARDWNMQNIFDHIYNIIQIKKKIIILLIQSQYHIN